MLKIVETKNLSTLNRLLGDDDIFDAISDDLSKGSRDATPFLGPSPLLLEVLEDGNAAGVFAFRAAGEGVLEMHTIMGRECRGRKALEAGAMAVNYVKTKGYKIVSCVFSDAPAQMWFAKKLGFSETARQPHHTTRHNAPVDVVYLTHF